MAYGLNGAADPQGQCQERLRRSFANCVQSDPLSSFPLMQEHASTSHAESTNLEKHTHTQEPALKV